MRKNRKGFTIVELVIVIGVIGILSAILIPTFVNLTKNAEQARLQSNLANAYSMYAAEASDGFVDGYFTANDESATIAIEFKDRTSVRLTDSDSGVVYSFVESTNKWTSGATAGTNVVTTAATYKLDSNDAIVSADVSAAELSTFGGYVVSYVAE